VRHILWPRLIPLSLVRSSSPYLLRDIFQNWTEADSKSEYNGAYLEDCNIVRPLKPYAADKSKAERLWEMSEEMVGEKFEY
jgi:hypothetical protein